MIPSGRCTAAPAWPMTDEKAGTSSNVVPGALERLHRGGVEAALEAQARAFLTPGAPEHPARRRHRLLERPAEEAVAREDRGLALRLAVAAHGAVDHDAPVVEARERRVVGVEGPAARQELVERAGPEREGHAAVLPQDAGIAQRHARAELPIDAVDEAHGEPVPVDRPHPHGVARRRIERPGAGARAVDPCRHLRERPIGEEILGGHAHMVGVGELLVAHAEAVLGRLDGAVHMGEAVRLGNAETVEDAENDE